MIEGDSGRYQRFSLILRACSSACAASAPRAALRCSAWASAAATRSVSLAWSRVPRSLLRLSSAPRSPSTVPDAGRAGQGGRRADLVAHRAGEVGTGGGAPARGQHAADGERERGHTEQHRRGGQAAEQRSADAGVLDGLALAGARRSGRAAARRCGRGHRSSGSPVDAAAAGPRSRRSAPRPAGRPARRPARRAATAWDARCDGRRTPGPSWVPRVRGQGRGVPLGGFPWTDDSVCWTACGCLRVLGAGSDTRG